MAINSTDGPKAKITLTGTQLTLILTLWAKHINATKAANPALGDRWAGHVVEQINYDFASNMAVSPAFAAIVANRALIFDEWTTDAIKARTKDESDDGVTVLHLACGLDARSLRLNALFENDPRVRWIDVDVPEVADLRRRLLPDPKGDYRLIGADVVAEDDWLASVPDDRPTMAVFEGLVIYLDPEDGKELLRRLVERFSAHGGEIAFDTVSSFVLLSQRLIPRVNSNGAYLRWAIDDGRELEKIHPTLRLKETLYGCAHHGVERYEWPTKYLMYVLRYLPYLNGLGINLRLQF